MTTTFRVRLNSRASPHRGLARFHLEDHDNAAAELRPASSPTDGQSHKPERIECCERIAMLQHPQRCQQAVPTTARHDDARHAHPCTAPHPVNRDHETLRNCGGSGNRRWRDGCCDPRREGARGREGVHARCHDLGCLPSSHCFNQLRVNETTAPLPGRNDAVE